MDLPLTLTVMPSQLPPLLKTRKCVFDTFTARPFPQAQLTKSFASTSRLALMAVQSLAIDYTFELSAYVMLGASPRAAAMSAVCRVNSTGPKIEPCLMPYFTSTYLLTAPSKSMHWALPTR
jgi:hypothetical protein